MKLVFVLVAFFAVAFANDAAEIVHLESEVNPDSFKYGFETSDGTFVQQSGHLEDVGTEDEALAVQGSFKYIGDDGQTYEVNYIADKNGYQPQGNHLPSAPVA